MVMTIQGRAAAHACGARHRVSQPFRLLALLACVGVIPALHAAERDATQNYPAKPIRFIVPYPAGAGTDTTARTVAAKLAERWGHQVVVDNRTGAGGSIAIESTANANPD